MLWRRECDLENRAVKSCMRQLLIPIATENGDALVLPAAQKLSGYMDYGEGATAHRKHFTQAGVELTVSRSRSWAFWALRFVKESYVWLVWIPLLLLGVGIGMNLLAVTVNHGIMPVVLPPSGIIADKDKMHVAATANSRFLFLCDWIQLHATKHVASPGDFLITAGDFLKWPLVWMWVGFSWGQSTWRKPISCMPTLS